MTTLTSRLWAPTPMHHPLYWSQSTFLHCLHFKLIVLYLEFFFFLLNVRLNFSKMILEDTKCGLEPLTI